MLFKGKPAYTRALVALTVSGIGTAFTSVVVYSQLAKNGFGPVGFAFTFAAALLPGFFTSLIAGRKAAGWDPRTALMLGQLMGLVSLIFPIVATSGGSPLWLILSEMMASAVGGLLLPVFKRIERSSFDKNEFAALAVIDTFLLTANFVCGQGLGSLLISQMSTRTFLMIDAVTYLIALILISGIETTSNVQAALEKLEFIPSLQQKRALMILPWLAFVCAPAMILMPSQSVKFHSGLFGMAPVLVLLCSRTAGQILGPLFAARMSLETFGRKSYSLPSALGGYLLFYAAAFGVSESGLTYALPVCAVLIVIAHILSNIVYTFGNVKLLQEFNADEMAWASARIYRQMTLIMGIAGLTFGALETTFGFAIIFAVGFLALAVGTFIFTQKGVSRAISAT